MKYKILKPIIAGIVILLSVSTHTSAKIVDFSEIIVPLYDLKDSQFEDIFDEEKDVFLLKVLDVYINILRLQETLNVYDTDKAVIEKASSDYRKRIELLHNNNYKSNQVAAFGLRYKEEISSINKELTQAKDALLLMLIKKTSIKNQGYIEFKNMQSEYEQSLANLIRKKYSESRMKNEDLPEEEVDTLNTLNELTSAQPVFSVKEKAKLTVFQRYEKRFQEFRRTTDSYIDYLQSAADYEVARIGTINRKYVLLYQKHKFLFLNKTLLPFLGDVYFKKLQQYKKEQD